jgi:hypothetical protein
LVVDLQHPELTLPTMKRLFADLPLAADILDLAARPIRLPEDADLFFGYVSLTFHFLGPL